MVCFASKSTYCFQDRRHMQAPKRLWETVWTASAQGSCYTSDERRHMSWTTCSCRTRQHQKQQCQLVPMWSSHSFWIAASPDRKEYDPTRQPPYGLLEIKCPQNHHIADMVWFLCIWKVMNITLKLFTLMQISGMMLRQKWTSSIFHTFRCPTVAKFLNNDRFIAFQRLLTLLFNISNVWNVKCESIY